MKMQPGSQKTPALGCPPRTAAGLEWTQPEPRGQAVCAMDGRGRETDLLRGPLELRRLWVSPRCQTLDVLQLNFGFAFI